MTILSVPVRKQEKGGLPGAVNDVRQQAARHANISEYQRYVIRTLRGGDGSSVRMLRRFRVCEFKIDGRAVAPESFEPVEFARFLVHDMNHEITVVKQHPLALGQALARARLTAGALKEQVLSISSATAST